MSLLGRLEDLSLPDIVQIVFLSRRTGILEIIENAGGRSTILFNHGLIVSATSPRTPDLLSYLRDQGLVNDSSVEMLQRTAEAGIPPGVAILEMNLANREILADLVQKRITATVAPLLDSRDGEFNFILTDALSHAELEYDPRSLFEGDGISPQKVLGAAEGEKLKPLRGLEESMRAGRELLRSHAAATAPPAPAPPPPAPGEVHFDELDEDPFETAGADAALAEEPLGALLDQHVEAIEEPPEIPMPSFSSTPEGLFDDEFEVVESPGGGEATQRHVVLFESSPLLRVAARRAFEQARMTIDQFGLVTDASKAVEEALREERPFVTILELTDPDDESSEVMQLIRRIREVSSLLPVVVMDREANLRRRARLLASGADHYITRPSEAHLQPALADEQLAIFADELVRFAEKRFEDLSSNPEAPPEWKEAAVHHERSRETNEVLKHLINELSNPNDLEGMVGILLRLASQYLDRSAVLVGRDRNFVGLGAMGDDGVEERVRALRISYADPSVIGEVAASGESRIGRITRSPANEALLRAMGTSLPTSVAVMPIRNREKVVGILYGDNGIRREPFEDLAGLELFLEQAGFALENAVIASAKRGVHQG